MNKQSVSQKSKQKKLHEDPEIDMLMRLAQTDSEESEASDVEEINSVSSVISDSDSSEEENNSNNASPEKRDDPQPVGSFDRRSDLVSIGKRAFSFLLT